MADRIDGPFGEYLGRVATLEAEAECLRNELTLLRKTLATISMCCIDAEIERRGLRGAAQDQAACKHCGGSRVIAREHGLSRIKVERQCPHCSPATTQTPESAQIQRGDDA